jgi:hypothetical protein
MPQHIVNFNRDSIIIQNSLDPTTKGTTKPHGTKTTYKEIPIHFIKSFFKFKNNARSFFNMCMVENPMKRHITINNASIFHKGI